MEMEMPSKDTYSYWCSLHIGLPMNKTNYIVGVSEIAIDVNQDGVGNEKQLFCTYCTVKYFSSIQFFQLNLL